MTSLQLADTAKYGAIHFTASDATEHRAALEAASKQTSQYELQQAARERHSAMLAQINAAFSA